MKKLNIHFTLRVLVGVVLLSFSTLYAKAQTLREITIRVYLNNDIVDPLYDEDNELSPGETEGLTINGNCSLGQGLLYPDHRIELYACAADPFLPYWEYPGDTLTLHILNPDLYRSSLFGQVAIDHWEVDGVNVGNSSTITHFVEAPININVFLTQTLSLVQRDPVSPRWSPDAARRSGGDLSWGPGYLRDKSLITDVTAEGYPALLYSAEAFEKQVDFAVVGRGLDFVFSRVHRSGEPDNERDYFGGQWTHSFDAVAQAVSDAVDSPIMVKLGNGLEEEFRRRYYDSTTRYYYAEGWDAELRLVFESLAMPRPAHYELVFGDGVKWRFKSFNNGDNATAATPITGIEDRFGNAISLTYDTNARLGTITDTRGREYTLAYNADNTISSLTEEDGLGRVISYGYEDGRLETVTYPATTAFPSGSVISYTYDDDGRLETVVDPRGNEALTNSYGADGRLVSQQFGEGDEASTVTYTYTGLSLQTGEDHAIRVADGEGHRTEHFFNDLNQLVRLFRAENDGGYTTRIAWEEHVFDGSIVVSDDLPATVTLPEGMVVTYEYAGPGTADADYRYRMNLTEVERTGTDGKTLFERYGHDMIGGEEAYWDARFGESFATCRRIYDGSETLLGATAYTYSSDGKATLDGIDYYGVPAYAGDPFANCPPSSSSQAALAMQAGTALQSSLLAAEGLYTTTLQQLSSADSLYENALLDPSLSGGEVGANASSAADNHHEMFGYNVYGQMTERLHPDNDEDGDRSDVVRRRDTFVYDANGYLYQQVIDTDGLMLTTTFTNDAVGRCISTTDPKSNMTEITYDALDQVLTIEGPELSAAGDERPLSQFTYDENGNVIRTRTYWFDQDGVQINAVGESSPSNYLATEYTLDSRNRVTRIGRENGEDLTRAEIEYDKDGNIITERSPLAVDASEPDNLISHVYDVRGLPTRIIRGNEIETRYDYDAGGRVIRIIEGCGAREARLTSFEYDGLGYVRSRTDAAGLTTVFTRDALGRVTKAEAKSGSAVLARTEYTYSLPGRLTTVNAMHTNENGGNVEDGWQRTVFSYTDAGMLMAEAVEDHVTHYSYDSAMRRERVRLPGGSSWQFAYDANSSVITVTESAIDTESGLTTKFITRYAYDEMNRVISAGSDNGDTNSSDAKETLYAYDSLGQLVEETDARGNVTANIFDPLGHLQSTTHNPGGIEAVLEYAYDANDRLTAMTDPAGNETQYAYDMFNRLVRTEYADGQIESFLYDALDNVIEHIAPDGLKTSTTHDAAGRPVAQAFSDLAGRENPGTTTFGYDALGRIVEARNADSVVTHAYDSMSNPVSETIQYGANAPATVLRTFNNKGLLSTLNPPGTASTFTYMYDTDGRLRQLKSNGTALAYFDYLGGRPNARAFKAGPATTAASTAIAYEDTGKRPSTITHKNTAGTTVDARGYSWDDAYNLDAFQVTTGSLAASPVDYAYDALNRIDPDSPGFNPAWSFDDAGNRSGGGYSFTGQDALMHRYTQVNTEDYRYDARGALVKAGIDENHSYEYSYDAANRLAEYREVTLADSTPFGAMNLSEGAWTTVNGAWSVNNNGTPGDTSDDYLEETTSAIGALLYQPSPYPDFGFTFRYRSAHAPDNPDGDGTPREFSGDDYPAKYYAQVLFGVDTASAPPYPYAALRIEPDRLTVVCYDGTTVRELDSAAVETRANEWYTVRFRVTLGGPRGAALALERSSSAAGDAMIPLLQSLPMSALAAVEPLALGFTVGAAAGYQFQLVEYGNDIDTANTSIGWAYDAYGRKIAQSVYGAEGALTAQTLYVRDGWRLVSEVDGLTGNVVAEYAPGPGYIDDIVASRRDLDGDGDFSTSESFFHLTDQQYSTVALVAANGDVLERYGYDAFGTPTVYDGSGAVRSESLYGNTRLYTGREWLRELDLYDYRNRLYDPALGRFLTPDPVYDPANLGNPYTYVGNNPGAFVDPWGLSWDRLNEPIESPGFWGHIGRGFTQLWEDVFGASDPVGAVIASQNSIAPLTSYDVTVNRDYLTSDNTLNPEQSGASRYGMARERVDALGRAARESAENVATDAAITAVTGGLSRVAPRARMFRAADELAEGGASAKRSLSLPLSSFQRAAEFGIHPVRQLRLIKPLNEGLEIHHIIPRRFSSMLSISPDDMLAVALTREEHLYFTQQWRKVIPYGERTENVSLDILQEAAKDIYEGYPDLLRAAMSELLP